jgi:membrane protein
MEQTQTSPTSQTLNHTAIRLRLATLRDTLSDASRNYRANGDTNQAAAIALYTILSIIPLFILTLLMAGHLFSAEPDLQKRFIDVIRQFIPTFSEALMKPFAQIHRKKDLLGWVGIISLIWFSAMIFSAIETALNITFRSRIYRNYLVSKLLAIAMIPLGWAVGVASVAISYVAAILAKQPIIGRDGLLFFPFLHGTLFRYLLPYLVTVAFFTVLYKVIPTVKISFKHALIGSAIFSALMEIAKQFFTWYVANYTHYDVIFGSLEAVVILMFWAFYVAIILLFCAELISSYRRRDMLLIEKALLGPRKDGSKIDERLFRKFGRFYGPDEYIFREGESSQSIYYILSGRVRMEKNAGQVKKALAEMGPGDYFGEMAALIQTPRTASARSLEESHIAVIDAATLRSLLKESDEVSLFMLQEFSNRIRHTNAALEEMTQAWIRLSVVLYLTREWPLDGHQDPVAELTAITGREASDIQEVLGWLGQRGVLTRTGDRLTGFNREAAWQLLDGKARN